MALRFAIAACALAGCAHVASAPTPPTVGIIAGIARDHDSGEPIAHAKVVLRADGELRSIERSTDRNGAYAFDAVRPGIYDVTASFAGHRVEVEHVEVRAGHRAIADLGFLLGHDDVVRVVYSDARLGAIEYVRPRDLSPALGAIEGTITDVASHERVAGAVITTFTAGGADAKQTISDDDGRYRFDELAPGAYVVSAYYTISGHGRIELRRSDIAIHGGEAAVVPLWVEMSSQAR